MERLPGDAPKGCAPSRVPIPDQLSDAKGASHDAWFLNTLKPRITLRHAYVMYVRVGFPDNTHSVPFLLRVDSPDLSRGQPEYEVNFIVTIER